MVNIIKDPQEGLQILSFWKEINKLLGNKIPQNLINKLSNYTQSGNTSLDTIDKLENIFDLGNLGNLEKLIQKYNLNVPNKIKEIGGIKDFLIKLFSEETREKIAQILEEKANKRIAEEEYREKQEQLQKKKQRFVSKFNISFGEFDTNNIIKFWAELLNIDSFGIQTIISFYNEEKDIVEIKIKYYNNYKIYALDFDGNINFIKEGEIYNSSYLL